MILRGNADSFFAFNNMTSESDLELICSMIHSTLDEVDFSTMQYVLSAEIAGEKEVHAKLMNSVEKVINARLDDVLQLSGLKRFSISVELFNSATMDVISSYIYFLFDAKGKIEGLLIGLNELSNSYFASYQYGPGTHPFGKFPLIGSYPSPFLGVVDQKIVCSIISPTEPKLSAKLINFGDLLVAGKTAEALDKWSDFCLGETPRLLAGVVEKELPRGKEDLIDLGVTFTISQVDIVDALVNDQKASEANYSKINGYNDLVKSILTDGIKKIAQT